MRKDLYPNKVKCVKKREHTELTKAFKPFSLVAFFDSLFCTSTIVASSSGFVNFDARREVECLGFLRSGVELDPLDFVIEPDGDGTPLPEVAGTSLSVDFLLIVSESVR